MKKRTKALASWVLALTFICLIVTGFALMYHVELFGLRGYPLKVVHINLAILSMVAGIGHLYFNLETLCKYVWVPKKGANMFGTFLVALAMTVAVITFSAMTPNRCDSHGPGRRAGAGHGQGQGQGYGRGEGRGQGRGQGYEQGGEQSVDEMQTDAHPEGFGQGRGQGGPGRGLGPGGGRGLGRGQGYGRGGGGASDTNELPTEPPVASE